MTEAQKKAFLDRTSVVLYKCLVDIRNWSCEPGNERRIFELSDVLHNVPMIFAEWNEFEASTLHGALKQFEQRWFGTTGWYSMILDSDDAELDARLRPGKALWPTVDIGLAAVAG